MKKIMTFAFVSSLFLFSCGTSGSPTRNSTPASPTPSPSPSPEVTAPAKAPNSSLSASVPVLPVPALRDRDVVNFEGGVYTIRAIYDSVKNDITVTVSTYDGGIIANITAPNVAEEDLRKDDGRVLLGRVNGHNVFIKVRHYDYGYGYEPEGVVINLFVDEPLHILGASNQGFSCGGALPLWFDGDKTLSWEHA
jgi:hypothetical protein